MMQFSSVLLAGAGVFLVRLPVTWWLWRSVLHAGVSVCYFYGQYLGSFLIGFISELAVSSTMVSPQARLFLVTGFCGGFTTFSSYMYEGASLVRDGQLLYTGVYLAGSVIGGFAALYSGTLAAKPWT